MVSREDYLQRVMILANYCYPERSEHTVRLVFSCIKSGLSEKDIREIRDLLPEPVNALWMESTLNEKFNDNFSDCITLAKERGHYPYRAAVERDFEVVMASIREMVDDDAERQIKELLPSPVQNIFEQSKSCALDGSAEDFL